MDFKDLCREDGYFDTTGFLSALLTGSSKWNILADERRCGKTTLLSMLYYYFERSEKSESLFSGLNIAKEYREWRAGLNAYDVIALDFSDFEEKTMKTAKRYIYEKLKKIYFRKFEYVFENASDHVFNQEQYIRILSGYWTDEALQSGLRNILFYCQRASQTKMISDGIFNPGEQEYMPVLLIDNAVLLEKVAKKYGYSNEMRLFIRNFFDFEPDRLCSFYLQTGDESLEWHYWWQTEYICYHPDYVHANSHAITELSDRFCHYVEAGKIRLENASRIKLTDSFQMKKKSIIGKAIQAYISKRIDDAVKAERSIWIKRERYAKPLDSSVPKYSGNMGLRNYLPSGQGRNKNKLNTLLRALYRQVDACKDFHDLYSIMQRLDINKPSGWTKYDTDMLVRDLASAKEGWTIRRYNSDEYWDYIRVDAGKAHYYPGLSNIKVYITLKDKYFSKTLKTLLTTLFLKAGDGYMLKISKYHRDESACLWLRKNEFLVIRDFFKNNRMLLRSGLPFVAHIDGIGASHDLMDNYSHNAQQAMLIWDYFSIVREEEAIDIDDMYSHYVEGWNGISEKSNDVFRKDFEDSTAQSFVILMDTLGYITGRHRLTENSFLLSDDSEAWNLLARARCWGDVGVPRPAGKTQFAINP